jgi:hypothetical protein
MLWKSKSMRAAVSLTIVAGAIASVAGGWFDGH